MIQEIRWHNILIIIDDRNYLSIITEHFCIFSHSIAQLFVVDR
jgi:hypothetical protein